ncbi:hypothetical protein A3A93_04085 [Candidatus Roizmanbacteria bacterium RIFCSPLOWO2_01_FULL_38_12]|uniref:SHS2 domain-containing protein n=1 Tax=Candidatus Roizmanbacteria bacterium RIFCSPLOWO2_01_FULL_38_12 TaxID=1802061 RepID=A0A1F7IV07_9BACT|nr:MAG: hypothetical protein A2861_00540 [Candidatus Roizmanbacteria bacterium RIFCSPHIGHO2_01_FULL_38_15]OGK35031.1 MAG: hypothetical protein A3F59_00260 [Candidatus Roizmanbacteria bacterium RIFCSPHIGHO2_12_FULL_38_13]OGK47186.1 MAG: hypothetical protein A3A93_04085 [Candidatus Roizmanbacteria bacterium RIFCSPLOWO2_01_FULL_38_12]
MAANVFSLHIDDYLTKVAHINYSKGQIELLSLGYDATVPNFFANPNEKTATAQSQVISQLVHELNINQTAVQITIPDALTYSQLTVMPDLRESELAKSIRLQIDEFVPLPISDVNVDFEVINKLPDGRLLILIEAIQNKIATHIAHTTELAKLEAISLESDQNVLGRFFTEIDDVIKEPSIIFNLGFSSSSIYVKDQQTPYFQFSKNMRLGYQMFIRDTKVNFNVDDKKAIEILQKIGLAPNASINVTRVIDPLVGQIVSEIARTIQLMRDKNHLNIKHIFLMNYDIYINYLHNVLQNKLSVLTMSIPLGNMFVANPITQSFRHSLSSFLPVVAGHLR